MKAERKEKYIVVDQLDGSITIYQDEEKKNEATTTNKTNTGKVNTGVETQFVTNAALMGVAALGIVEAKKRSKK